MVEVLEGSDKGLERILGLTDDVFAFSLTLMALSLVVPQLTSGQSSPDLASKLAGMAPDFIIFFFSFMIGALYWIAHHRIFRYVQRYDGVLIWCNFLMLMFVTLVPFIAALNMHYGDLQSAVVVSALFYSMPGFAMSALWYHASKGHLLIDKELPKGTVKMVSTLSIMPPLVFIVSIPLSFVHPYLTLFFWLLMFPLRTVIIRRSGKKR